LARPGTDTAITIKVNISATSALLLRLSCAHSISGVYKEPPSPVNK